MIGAFLFATGRSVKNRLLAALRRLKRPRYLLFALLGMAYFYTVAGRHWVRGISAAERVELQEIPTVLPEIAVALLILIGAVVSWCAPTPLAPMAFTEAEIQHLFTAPIPRRGLVQWKLLRGQIGVLFGVMMVTLVFGSQRGAGGSLMFLVGAWIAFTTMQLHSAGARMTIHSLARSGITWGLRLIIVAPAAIAALAGSVYWSWSRIGPPPQRAADYPEAMSMLPGWVERMAETGPARILLAPGRLLARPALAPDLTAFLIALLPAAALLAAGYVWVIRSRAVLEEGAAEAARKLAGSRAAARARGRRSSRVIGTPPPFRLSPTGRPEIALLWKNLIAAFRNIGGFRLLILLFGGGFVMIVGAIRISAAEAAQVFAATFCAMIAGMLLLVGPSILRIDFRQEFAHMDALRSYPLSGRTLLVGTLMAPTLILTVSEWLLLAGFALLTGRGAGDAAPWRDLVPWLALAGAIMAAPLTAMASLLHNAAFILAPAWVSLGPQRSMGVERIGQNLFSTFALLLVMALSLLPSALLFGVTWLVCSAFIGSGVSLPLSALPAAGALTAEWFLGVILLGAQIDRFDPSRELDSVAPQG